MTDDKIFLLLNDIFFDFEDNIFINNGIWPRKVNLVFAFSDYIEQMSDLKIASYLKTNNPKKIAHFRSLAQSGIEQWLKENMKTLMI